MAAQSRPELKAEGYARCTMELEPVGGAVKLTDHPIDRSGRFQDDRGRLGRLAADPLQPQVAAGDRKNDPELTVYHLKYEPTRTTACKHYSCVMGGFAGGLVRLARRDTAFAAVSRPPIAKIDAFKRRMKRALAWPPSFASDFNADFHVMRDPTEE